jgi:hypothetical protein
MTKRDILYTNLLIHLQSITEGNDFDTFLSSIEQLRQERLIELCEEIRLERNKIVTASQGFQFYSDYSTLIQALEAVSTEFPEYVIVRPNELFALLAVIQRITSELGESTNLVDVLDISIFGMCEVDCKSSVKNFVFANPTTVENSILYFDIGNRAELNSFINSSTNIGFFFYLINHFCKATTPLTGSNYVLISHAIVPDTKKVVATLCLHLVINGFTVHTPYDYTAKPINTREQNILAGKSYQQFNDSINILSEYNYQNDILDKYLRIYHVIENFMFKRPLVELETQFPGQVFSIRDFQRMYSKVDKKEATVLYELIESIFQETYSATQTFGDYISNKWKLMVPMPIAGTPAVPGGVTINHSNCDYLIKLLNIYSGKDKPITHVEIHSANFDFKSFFSKLIYQFRNSIVHNRETEFHLTHSNLLGHPMIADTAKQILEQFLIPVLEEIIFYLIIENNSLVWYNGDHLKLWES